MHTLLAKYKIFLDKALPLLKIFCLLLGNVEPTVSSFVKNLQNFGYEKYYSSKELENHKTAFIGLKHKSCGSLAKKRMMHFYAVCNCNSLERKWRVKI